jgi:CDP-glucose 4,6-dehydratase
MNHTPFSNRRVLITGHTGFKGAWLTQWLLHLGAEVTGYSLNPPTTPSLFDQLDLKSKIRSIHGDVRDLTRLTHEVTQCRPDFVFHLAAQSLVRYSYREPVETFCTNAIGTVNILESLRNLQHPCVAVMVTTDKCYQNQEWLYGYRELDALGGDDPYSSSKAMAELAILSYQRSWFSRSSDVPRQIRLASARAGNVIGGGDWAQDRIVPDCIRSLLKNEPIPVRNRHARRPWQHVLDPLSGYLRLAETMANAQSEQEITERCSAFNFGPPKESNRSVGTLVDEILQHWPGLCVDHTEPNPPHEATLLHLCTEKANAILNWYSLWDFSTSLRKTVEWYRRVQAGEKPADVTLEHICHYESDFSARRLASKI